MKKKYLLTSLLALPLLLSSCGGAKNPGTKGDNVLTEEQINSVFINEEKSLSTEVKKVGSFTIPHDKTHLGTSNHRQLGYYTLDESEGESLNVVSFLTAKNVLKVSDYDDYDIDFKYDIYNTTSIELVLVITYKTDAESKEHFHYYLVDGMGHILFDKEFVDEFVQVRYKANAVTVYDNEGNEGKEYTVRVGYYDTLAGKNVEEYYRYSEDFSAVTKIQDYYAKEAKKNVERYFFNVGEEEKAVKYSVEVVTVGSNESVISVSHLEKEAEVVNVYDIPSVDFALLDHHLIYQESIAMHENAKDYDVRNGATLYKFNTHILDLIDGERKTVEFPYQIAGAVRCLNFDKVPVDEIELNKYGAISVRGFENKGYKEFTNVYVIDSGLVFHDDLSNRTYLTKLGNGYISGTSLYDANQNYFAALNGSIEKRYDNAVLSKYNNIYYLNDETGKDLVAPVYTSCEIINERYLHLSNAQGELYFDVSTLKPVAVAFDKNAEYLKDDQNGFYVKKAEATLETDAVYYLDKQIDTIPVYTAAVDSLCTLHYAKGQNAYTEYEAVTAVNAEGDYIINIYKVEAR